MHPILEITVRALIAFVFIFIIAEILGSKQISQLTFFDYIVGITLGSVAATMAIDDALPIWYGLIVMGVFVILPVALNILTRKSIWARRIFEGRPIVLISEGKIIFKELKRAQFAVNDLLRELRTQGYFNIADVNHAILETNGMVSVLPKSAKRPVVTEDINLALPNQGLCANVIIDGKIMAANLKAMGRDENWLYAELNKQGVKLENLLLATLDTDYCLSTYERDQSNEKRTILQ